MNAVEQGCCRSQPSPQTARSLWRASKITVQRSLTLLFVACLAAPGIGSAQTVIAPAPLPVPPLPPRLFIETVPESSGRPDESIKSLSWWEPPASGSEIPRWAIGHTLAFKTPGGLALSAGFFGRRGDPLPLYLSQGVAQRAASNSVTHPSTYKLHWDAKFGVSAPLRNGPQLKINAIGEVFVPLTGSTDPSAAFLTSRAFRFGVVVVF